MTNREFSNEIESQAKYWLWRIAEGLSQHERQTFVAWVNQDNKHHLALHKYSPSIKTTKILTEFNGLFPLEKSNSSKFKTLFSKCSLAASVIFLCLLTSEAFLNKNLFSFFHQPVKIVYQEFSTKVGEQANFSLPDGSIVHLNTNSLLTISFSKDHRQLDLIKGEATFEVAKDKLRPFSVTSGQQSFTALGTIFNVQKNSNNELELIVTEGRVLIASSNERLAQLSQKIADSAQQSMSDDIIIAGEKTTIKNKVQINKSKVSAQVDFQELAWKKGVLIFDGESLATALNEISRYTELRFIIEDKELANKKVAGYFRTGDIDALLSSISDNLELNYTKTDHHNVLITGAYQSAKAFNMQ